MTHDIRFDSIKLPKMSVTPEGYLRGEAVVSRAGVFKYRNIDGSIRGELRHPDNIFTKESLDSLKMIPITNDHPPEFVDASNAHKYQVGYTGERYDIDEDKVIVSMTVTHLDAIEAIKRGKLELSLGYGVNLKLEKGEYEGENYDAVQLEPKYNHLALVQRGRAGSVARMRFDNACELIESELSETNKQEDFNNKTNELEMTKETNNRSDNRIDALTLENEQLMTKLKSLQGRLDEAESELEKEKALKADSIIEARVIDRACLIAKATPFLKDTESLFKKTDREIMETTINTLRGDAICFTERADDYVKGVFETLTAVPPREHMDPRGEVVQVIRSLRNNDEEANMNKLPKKAIIENLRNKIFNLKEGD
jgi:hypothetical protein